MKTYWIGDIHGCFKTFEKLLSRIPSGYKIGLLGDINDRGTGTLPSIKLALDKADYMLMGNHESLMEVAVENYMDRSCFELWMRCGGHSVADELNIYHYDDFKQMVIMAEPEIEMIERYLAKCKMSFSCDDYVAAHACIPSDFNDANIDIDTRLADKLLWGTDDSIGDSALFAKSSGKQVILHRV